MTQPQVDVSLEAASGERDRVHVVMSLLDLTRWEAEAIVAGQYVVQDPLTRYCVKRFGNYQEVARFLMSWVGWHGELAVKPPSLAVRVAARLPWLWQEGHDCEQFPRVRCVTCEELPEALLQERSVTWMGDAFRTYCMARTEWERAQYAEALERKRGGKGSGADLTEEERLAAKLARGEETVTTPSEEMRFPQFNPEDAPQIWGEEGSALKERWRFLGFSNLPLPERVRTELWRSFELSMYCTVELRSLHREGACHELTTQALDVMSLWNAGSFPLFLSGVGTLQTLYVLVASKG